MLVLSRKVGEQIVMPDQGLSLTILEIRGDRVRLGITAPSSVAVYRQEVWARIQAGVAPAGQPGREHAGARGSSEVVHTA